MDGQREVEVIITTAIMEVVVVNAMVIRGIVTVLVVEIIREMLIIVKVVNSFPVRRHLLKGQSQMLEGKGRVRQLLDRSSLQGPRRPLFCVFTMVASAPLLPSQPTCNFLCPKCRRR